MSPRSYTLGRRQEQIDATREQTLDGAREVLRGATALGEFTVDAVARRADVARGTVYYQFGSKTGLLEALCDHLAGSGGLDELPAAFSAPDARQALARFVEAFAGFWQSDRVAMRRLRAFAELDTEVGRVIAARDERRRQGLDALVGRLVAEGHRLPVDRARAVRSLTMLTSFATFDALTDPAHDLHAAVPEILELAGAALGVALPDARLE